MVWNGGEGRGSRRWGVGRAILGTFWYGVRKTFSGIKERIELGTDLVMLPLN